jgi:hypothetical protein
LLDPNETQKDKIPKNGRMPIVYDIVKTGPDAFRVTHPDISYDHIMSLADLMSFVSSKQLTPLKE